MHLPHALPWALPALSGKKGRSPVREMLDVVPASERNPAGLRRLLAAHPEIRFVSLSGVDLGGNDTDEKIPVSHFLEHAEEYLAGGVQTDGSSVVLPGIATLNDGKVDLVADHGVRWYVDYNHEHPDPATGLSGGHAAHPLLPQAQGQVHRLPRHPPPDHGVGGNAPDGPARRAPRGGAGRRASTPRQSSATRSSPRRSSSSGSARPART